jgi:hypothetical protein
MFQTSESAYFFGDFVDGHRSFVGENLEDGAVEFGFSALEDREPSVLVFVSRHNWCSPSAWVKQKVCAEGVILVNLHIFVCIGLGENVSAGRNALAQNAFSDSI